MKVIAHLLCIIACLPTIAATLEDRLAQIQAVEGVQAASIIMDAETKAPALSDMPGFPGWRIATIAYLIIDNDSVQDNSVSIAIDPDGNTLWSQRAPAILNVVPEREGPISTDEEIITAIESDQNITALKYNIEYDIKGADVLVVVEISGKVLEQYYRVYKSDGTFAVKRYDSSTETKALESR